jgi:hypothetical protein
MFIVTCLVAFPIPMVPLTIPISAYFATLLFLSHSTCVKFKPKLLNRTILHLRTHNHTDILIGMVKKKTQHREQTRGTCACY